MTLGNASASAKVAAQAASRRGLGEAAPTPHPRWLWLPGVGRTHWAWPSAAAAPPRGPTAAPPAAGPWPCRGDAGVRPGPPGWPPPPAQCLSWGSRKRRRPSRRGPFRGRSGWTPHLYISSDSCRSSSCFSWMSWNQSTMRASSEASVESGGASMAQLGPGRLQGEAG